ncbi:hypothetical protein ABG067_005549 [Albugo candida]
MNDQIVEQIDAEDDDALFSDGRYPKIRSTPMKQRRKQSKFDCGKSKYSQSSMTSFLHEESPMRIDEPTDNTILTHKRSRKQHTAIKTREPNRWTQRRLFPAADSNNEEFDFKRSLSSTQFDEISDTNENLLANSNERIVISNLKLQSRRFLNQICLQFPPIQHIVTSKVHATCLKFRHIKSVIKVVSTNEAFKWDSNAWLTNSRESEESSLMQTFRERLIRLWSNFIDSEILDCTIDQMVSRLTEVSGLEPSRIKSILEVLALSRETSESKSNLTLLDKYFPIQPTGLVGNESSNVAFQSWLQSHRTTDMSSESESEYGTMKSMTKQCSDILVLSGASGVGKSALVHSSANALGINVIEVNFGQHRSRKVISDIIGEAAQSKCIMSELSSPKDLTLLLFDDVDIDCDQDKGFISAICEVAAQSKCPVVATCTKSPLDLRKYVQVSMKALEQSECCLYLAIMAFLERIPISYQLIRMVTAAFRCNIRTSVHFIQMYLPIFNQQSCCRRLLETDKMDPIVWQSHCTDRIQFLLTPFVTWGDTLRPYSFLCLRKVKEKPSTLLEDSATKLIKTIDVQMLRALTQWIDDVSLMTHWDEVVSTSGKFSMQRICVEMDVMALRRLSSMRSTSYSMTLDFGNTTCHRSIGMESTLRNLKKHFQTSQTIANLNRRAIVLDYFPYMNQMATATECAQHCRTNRKVSRRNHYLKETLPTMEMLKDLKALECDFSSIT